VNNVDVFPLFVQRVNSTVSDMTFTHVLTFGTGIKTEYSPLQSLTFQYLTSHA